MTDRDAVIHRIAGAIARKTASAAPAEVLAELSTTHVLVPLDWIADRRAEAWTMIQRMGVDHGYDRGFWDGCEAQLVEALIDCAGMEEQDVPPIQPVAASDTTET